jgi:hypothetical protein
MSHPHTSDELLEIAKDIIKNDNYISATSTNNPGLHAWVWRYGNPKSKMQLIPEAVKIWNKLVELKNNNKK